MFRQIRGKPGAYENSLFRPRLDEETTDRWQRSRVAVSNDCYVLDTLLNTIHVLTPLISSQLCEVDAIIPIL